jgi:hypothetical protein
MKINSEHVAMCSESKISLGVRHQQITVIDLLSAQWETNRHTGNVVKRALLIFRKAVY